jgi:phage terminase small subunit
VLTAKEDKFCNNVASGMTLTDAYKDSYDTENMTDKSINELACRLAKKVKIRSRIEELREKAQNKAIMSAIDRKKWLTKQIEDLSNNLGDRLKAIDILNKMSGEYITKVQGDVNLSYENTLKEVADEDEY